VNLQVGRRVETPLVINAQATKVQDAVATIAQSSNNQGGGYAKSSSSFSPPSK
jgi:hypothetical protein